MSIKTTSVEAIENTDTFGNYLLHGIDEIILPEAIAYYPSAPGWQVLGLVIGVLIVFQLSRWAVRWWRNRYRREALQQLELASQQAVAGKQLEDVVAVLPYYIKATALQAYPRQDVASLSGRDWLTFLDTSYSGPSFRDGIGEKLLAVAYLPREQWQLDDQQSKELIKISKHWIAKHRDVAHV